MSPRAQTVCSHPGCPTLTPSGACDEHKRQRKRNQARQRRASGDPSMDVYSTNEWRARRRAYLRTHPTCIRCGAEANEADHVVPRQLLVALGIHDPDDEQWLQPLCKPDHSRKTRLVDQPLLRRWRQGEAAQTLAEEAMSLRRVGGTT